MSLCLNAALKIWRMDKYGVVDPRLLKRYSFVLLPGKTSCVYCVGSCLLLLLLLTAIELSLGGSSPYTSTDKTNKNKCT